MDWGKIWSSIVDFFKSNVWNIVWFVAIFVIGLILIKIIMNITRRLLRKTRMEKIAQQFLCTAIKFVLYLIWILLLLSQIGVEVTGIITAFSAILLAVGMALESNIANVANGIVIISTHLFKKGDYIIVDGVEGNITDINFLFTTLITADNKKITLPNSTIVNSHVTNLGANPTRRVDFTFSVAYESDVELVKETIIEVMKSNGKVYLDPLPFCRLKYLQESSIDFFANCWCDNADYWDVYYYIVENVYNEFKRKGISVPYNQIEVRERKDKVVMPVIGDKLPERVEKERAPKEEHFDLENVDLSKVFKHNKKNKEGDKKTKQEKKTDKKQKKEKGGEVEAKSVEENKSQETAERKEEKPLKSKKNKKNSTKKDS